MLACCCSKCRDCQFSVQQSSMGLPPACTRDICVLSWPKRVMGKLHRHEAIIRLLYLIYRNVYLLPCHNSVSRCFAVLVHCLW